MFNIYKTPMISIISIITLLFIHIEQNKATEMTDNVYLQLANDKIKDKNQKIANNEVLDEKMKTCEEDIKKSLQAVQNSDLKNLSEASYTYIKHLCTRLSINIEYCVKCEGVLLAFQKYITNFFANLKRMKFSNGKYFDNNSIYFFQIPKIIENIVDYLNYVAKSEISSLKKNYDKLKDVNYMTSPDKHYSADFFNDIMKLQEEINDIQTKKYKHFKELIILLDIFINNMNFICELVKKCPLTSSNEDSMSEIISKYKLLEETNDDYTILKAEYNAYTEIITSLGRLDNSLKSCVFLHQIKNSVNVDLRVYFIYKNAITSNTENIKLISIIRAILAKQAEAIVLLEPKPVDIYEINTTKKEFEIIYTDQMKSDINDFFMHVKEELINDGLLHVNYRYKRLSDKQIVNYHNKPVRGNDMDTVKTIVLGIVIFLVVALAFCFIIFSMKRRRI